MACDLAHLVPAVIRAYIAEDSPLYADLVVRRIVAAVERLTAVPESGRVVPERGTPDIREVIVKPHRVVYRLRPGVVEIATVFRASRLFPTRPTALGGRDGRSNDSWTDDHETPEVRGHFLMWWEGDIIIEAAIRALDGWASVTLYYAAMSRATIAGASKRMARKRSCRAGGVSALDI